MNIRYSAVSMDRKLLTNVQVSNTYIHIFTDMEHFCILI